MNNFNPENSRREKNKRKQIKVVTKRQNVSIYDENGKIRATNEDVCDCFDATCEGCHFPCLTCNSQKCAIRCRNGRRFFYELIEYDGKDFQKPNPYYINAMNRN